ncbi:glycosyl transferase family 2 [Virgisporangium aliadipatigenens]|uniref:Glycosyl transferase family 2 n=1 Tax=Virgisporangium aliadipatigenens TaxID=741659 RepID=A0A8J4DQJ8_9ACTN|nr:glycosyltransferase family 2 protein [Virgisporangium aliadipatigenens]GIJ46689.1 glycosyl transferase family 2 [Virgisporangium aliadipatigenens]
MTTQRILMILPAWNEADSIGNVIGEIREVLPTVDILVVDDGSTDKTAQLAAEAGAKVAKLPYNLGVGGARRLGYKYAREHGYDVAVQFDSDGQHDPRYVPALVAALDSADLVIGARFAGEGDYQARGPRRWAMSLLSGVLSRVAKHKLTDTTSGLRVVARPLIDVYATWYPVEYLGDTIDTLAHVARGGYRVVQVPVTMRPRAGGVASANPFKSTVYLGRAVLVIVMALLRKRDV